MGVGGTCGPNCSVEVREIGQTARLSSRSPDDFTKRGGWIWTTRLHLARQARRCEGGFLVGRANRNSAGCAVMAPQTNWIAAWYAGVSAVARGTQVPGIDDVSHDWKLA